MIAIVSIVGSAASTYYLFLPKSITTLPASTITQTMEDTVTAIAPLTVIQTVTQSTTILLSSMEINMLNNSTGLELDLATNTSLIFSNPSSDNESGTILIVISLFNTLQTNNSLPAPQDWRLGDLSPGVCSAFNEPFGIEVMKGYYTNSNVTSGQPLPLFAPSFCHIYAPPAYFVFGPKSDNANLISYPQNFSSLITSSTLTLARITHDNSPLGDAERAIPLNGYCCRDLPGPQNCTCYTPGSIPFETGTYTVAGGDEWGDLVLLHFNVLP